MVKLCLSVLGVLVLCLMCEIYARPEDDKKIRPLPPAISLISGNLPKNDVDKCMEENGLTKDDLHDRMGKHSGEELPEKYSCFAKCIALKSGAIDKAGNLNINFIKSNFPPPMASEADNILLCVGKAKAVSTCKDMEKLAKCLPKPPMLP